MKTYSVVITPKARRDLQGLAEWITDAESEGVARGYLGRLQAFCAGFDLFPERGTRLPNGARRIGFEGRCAILFRVGRGEVRIQRVLYAGRAASPRETGES